jgi:hypothetical protein
MIPAVVPKRRFQVPESYIVSYEDENGRKRGGTVTILDGPSLPIACPTVRKRLYVRNFRISALSSDGAEADLPVSAPEFP